MFLQLTRQQRGVVQCVRVRDENRWRGEFGWVVDVVVVWVGSVGWTLEGE
jgi:hypothetical protein